MARVSFFANGVTQSSISPSTTIRRALKDAETRDEAVVMLFLDACVTETFEEYAGETTRQWLLSEQGA